MSQVLAIDIGSSRFRLGLFGEDGGQRAIYEGHTTHAGGRDWLLAELRMRGLELISRQAVPIQACGISFTGPVDLDGRRITSFHIPGWTGFDLGGWASETFGVPARTENDANAGARGEARYGAGRGKGSLVFLILTAGIGAGIILDGRLARGKDGSAGEIGHLPLLEGGPLCECGARGCFEALCSTKAIEDRAQGLARRVPETLARLIQMSGGEISKISAQTVFAAAAQNDDGAIFIIRETVRWLAHGVLTIIRLLSPDIIILGGELTQAGPTLLNPLKEALAEIGSPAFPYSTEIVLSALGSQSSLYGAAAVAWDIVEKK